METELEAQHSSQGEMLYMVGFEKGMSHIGKLNKRGFQIVSRCFFLSRGGGNQQPFVSSLQDHFTNMAYVF